MLQVPVALGGLQQRLGDRQAGVVHHEVDAAERQRRLADRGGDGRRVGDVDGHRDGDVRAPGRRDSDQVVVGPGHEA